MDNEKYPIQESKDIRFKEPTFIDPLTGLFNRYYLYQFLPAELNKAKLSNYPLSLLMVDLDGFKAINDKYGHSCGDEVLKQVGAILKKSIRRTDLIIRYAGDEFLVLLPTADVKIAEKVSRSLIDSIDKNAFKGKDGQDLHLTLSIGVAFYPEDSQDLDELINLADKALYLSKQKGKNRTSYAKEVTLEAVSYIVAMDSFPCPKFIDRKEQIDRLKYIFDTVVLKSDLLQVAFVTGEMGSGKTRLLTELNNYVRERAAIINCRSSMAHIQDPYFLFAKGVSDYIGKIGIDSLQLSGVFSRVSPLELGQLSRIVPPIAQLLNRPIAPEADDRKARFLLFKGFLDFLIELNKNQPVLILFDDIQWIDKASLELLRYLYMQEKNKRIFIACAYDEDKSSQRTDGFGPKALLEEVRFKDNFIQLELKDLSFEDTSAMIEAIFPGIEASKEFYELIYDVTKGRPSFIEEVLKLLVEESVISYQDNRWQIKKALSKQDIPYSMEEVIKKRVKNLDGETKEMIVQAAVIGEDFSLDLLKKLSNKDEGFITELLKRAKEMSLVDELKTKGDFGFMNNNIQSILYNELNNEQQNLLHYKIGQILANEHKDNIYNVAGELAFHFNRAPQQDKINEYVGPLLEKIEQIFNPAEAIEYLDKLVQDMAVEKEGVVTALSEKSFKETIRFIRAFQGAIKTFYLYPAGEMRSAAIEEAYSLLNVIFGESERLIVGEVERSLVINGRRISPKVADQDIIEYFLNLMLRHNLKTISFLKGVSQDELNRLIWHLIESPEHITEQGGWLQIISKDELKNIRVDEVRFVQLGASDNIREGKKKFEDAMLIEFLLGKISLGGIDRKAFVYNMRQDPRRFAQTIMDTAQKTTKEGKSSDEAKAVAESIEKINSQILQQESGPSEYIADLAKVISQLKPGLRNKVLRYQSLDKDPKQRDALDNIIKATPDEVIVDMLIEEYKESQGNLLVVKDTIEKLLTDTERRKAVLSKLEAELSKLKVSDEEIAFASGRIQWKDLPLDKRRDSIIKLPDRYYKSELGKIKALLGELDSRQNVQELQDTLLHLIDKAAGLPLAIRNDLMTAITDFIKTPPANNREDALGIEDRLDGLLKKLNIEADPAAFAAILEIFKEVIKDFTKRLQSSRDIISEMERPKVRKYCLFIPQLINILSKRFKWEKEHNPQIYKLIEDFLREISERDFLEILTYIIISGVSREKLALNDIFPIMQDTLIETLIHLETKRETTAFDPFQEYVTRKGIVNLLQRLGEPALNILQEKLSRFKDYMAPSLIELIGDLKKEEWVDLLMPLTTSDERAIRRAVVTALGEIGGERTQEIIRSMLTKEKDKKIRILAKRQLARLAR